MKCRALAKVCGVLMVALGAVVPIEAKAFPFEVSQEGFTIYLNSGKVKWGDNSKNYFYNPRDCGPEKSISGDGTYSHYKCIMDFDMTTSLGKRTCINYNIEYWIDANRVDKESYSSSAECSDWEKVSAPPELQSQPTPPQLQYTTTTCVDNNLILAGGAGIFLAGGLLGIAFSQLLGRKKD